MMKSESKFIEEVKSKFIEEVKVTIHWISPSHKSLMKSESKFIEDVRVTNH